MTTRGLPKRSTKRRKNRRAAFAFLCGGTRISKTFPLALIARHNQNFRPLIGITTLPSLQAATAGQCLIEMPLWKPKLAFRASQNAKPIPEAIDGQAVKRVLEENTMIDDLDTFMTEAGSSSLIVIKGNKLLFESYYMVTSAGTWRGHFPSQSQFSLSC